MSTYRYIATAMLACTALQTAAHAQDASKSNGAIEEVVVTAERRSEDVQKTPISVVVLTGDMMRNRGITDLNTLQAQVPSVSFTDYGNTKYLNIRGVGISESAPSQSDGVAMYWDGTYVAREFVFGDSFFDVSNIQVLRGPQGTYEGENANGGAIYVNSVKPDFDGLSGFAKATFGNLGRREGSAGVTFQLSDDLAARISGQFEHRDSAFTNLGPTGVAGPVKYPNQPGNLDRFVGRAQLLYRPSDDLEIRLIHQYSDRQTDGLPSQSFAGPVVGNRIVAYNTDQSLNTSYNRTTAIINYTGLSAFTVRAMGTYHTTDQLSVQDNDFTAGPNGVSSKVIIHDRYYTGEIDLISPGNQRFSWTAGATLLDYSQPGITAPAITPAQPYGQGLYFYTDSIRRDEAIFGEIGYKLTPRLQVKVGARNSWDSVGFHGSYMQIAGISSPKIPLNNRLTNLSAFTGRVVVDWQVTDNHFLYATVSRGYKPGGTTAFFNSYKSEYVLNYEVGWKARLFDDILTTSLSAFYMDYNGFQTTYATDPFNPATRSTRNVNGTTIKGVEGQLGLNWRHLHADASFSVLDAPYGSLDVAEPAGVMGGGLPAAPTLINLKGRQIPFAPKFSGAMGISYDIAVGDGSLTPSLRVSYQGAQWTDFFQAPYNQIPAKALVSARLTYTAAKNWMLTAYVDNLLNRTYIASVSQATNGIGDYVLGQPREFGVTLSYNF